MKKRLHIAESKWTAATLDCLFVLFLFCEIAFAHSRIGQATLLLFSAAALCCALLTKRVRISVWFVFYAAMIAWCGVCLIWSIRFATAFSMLRTVIINFVFVIALLQYLISRPFSKTAALYLAAIGAFVLYVFVFSDPLAAMSRFGWDVGVNPNAAGMVTSFAAGLSLYLATREEKTRGKALYFLPALLFALITALTGSVKAMIVLALIVMVYLILIDPKRAWILPVLGVLLLLGMYGLSKTRLMYEVPFFYKGYFHDVIWQRFEGIFILLEQGDAWLFETASERGALLQIGRDAIAARPLTGYGLDCFQHLTDAAGKAAGTYSHNNYVELLVSGGVPLLLIYYAPLVFLLVRAFVRMKKNRAVQIAAVLLLALFAADLAVVSYYDRTLLMVPALLCAAMWKGKQARSTGPLACIEWD